LSSTSGSPFRNGHRRWPSSGDRCPPPPSGSAHDGGQQGKRTDRSSACTAVSGRGPGRVVTGKHQRALDRRADHMMNDRVPTARGREPRPRAHQVSGRGRGAASVEADGLWGPRASSAQPALPVDIRSSSPFTTHAILLTDPAPRKASRSVPCNRLSRCDNDLNMISDARTWSPLQRREAEQ